MKNAEEKETEMFEHLGEEIPEEADVWSKVWDGQAVEGKMKKTT